MKKVFSLLLAVLMLVSALPVAYAAGTNDYTAGTAVVYTAANNEDYSITVPASLAPGSSGTVTLEGTWAPNTIISVTAETSVTLTNSINANDQKTLAVKFNGISEAGSNTSSQTFTAPVSVDPIENAIFGTWDGHFYYNVELTEALVNVRDLYAHQSGYINYVGDIVDDSVSTYVRIPVNEGESWFVWLGTLERLGSTMLRYENSTYEKVEWVNMKNQPKYQFNPDSSIEGAAMEIPAGVAYMCVTLKFASYWDVTDSAFIAKVNNQATSTWMVFGDSLTQFNNTSHRNWLSLASEELSANYYNLAVSGTGYVKTNSVGNYFIPQLTQNTAEVSPDLVVVFGSFNDLFATAEMGTATDTFVDGADNTIAAHMNHMYDSILAKYPSAKIAVIAPSPWSSTTPDGTDSRSVNAQQYVALMQEICESKNIPFLDLYHNSGLEPWNGDINNQYFYNADGTHPNDEGQKIIAAKITPFLQSVLNNTAN